MSEVIAMGDRICSVDDCERKVKARGWCWRHYEEWRKTADPSSVRARTAQVGGCSVDACDRDARTRGLCSPHYKMWHKHKTPTPRRRAEVVEGKRICPRCKVDVPLSDWGLAGICKPCNREHARGYLVPAPTTSRTCAVCGDFYRGNKRQSSTCSEPCRLEYKKTCDAEIAKAHPEKTRAAKERWRKANPEKMAEKERRRNARKRGAKVGPVDLDALWTGSCGICGDVIDRNIRWPDPQSKSLDHVHPLAKGGSHTQDNLQWSHLICNIRKGAKVASGAVTPVGHPKGNERQADNAEDQANGAQQVVAALDADTKQAAD